MDIALAWLHRHAIHQRQNNLVRHQRRNHRTFIFGYCALVLAQRWNHRRNIVRAVVWVIRVGDIAEQRGAVRVTACRDYWRNAEVDRWANLRMVTSVGRVARMRAVIAS